MVTLTAQPGVILRCCDVRRRSFEVAPFGARGVRRRHDRVSKHKRPHRADEALRWRVKARRSSPEVSVIAEHQRGSFYPRGYGPVFLIVDRVGNPADLRLRRLVRIPRVGSEGWVSRGGRRPCFSLKTFKRPVLFAFAEGIPSVAGVGSPFVRRE